MQAWLMRKADCCVVVDVETERGVVITQLPDPPLKSAAPEHLLPSPNSLHLHSVGPDILIVTSSFLLL
jgi:hypothetical protein